VNEPGFKIMNRQPSCLPSWYL